MLGVKRSIWLEATGSVDDGGYSPFLIYHFSFSIWSFAVVDFLFVSVRVISWIVPIPRQGKDPRTKTKHHEIGPKK